MTTTIYANYGLLGAEKRAVYSIAHGKIYDELVVDIPDDLYTGIGRDGDVLINAEGIIYLLREVLCGNDTPHICYFNGEHDVLRKLPVLSRTEHYDPMG